MVANRHRPASLFMLVLLMALLTLPIAMPKAQQPSDNGRVTGLPVPRFVSLRRDEVNVRFGPGKQYPINWVFTRRGIPVEIIAEFGNWRKIRDYEGVEGWINAGLLEGQRTIMIQGTTRDLKRTADAKARVVLKAQPGVIGRLFDCEGKLVPCGNCRTTRLAAARRVLGHAAGRNLSVDPYRPFRPMANFVLRSSSARSRPS